MSTFHNNRIQKINAAIEENAEIFDGFIGVYLFGSFIENEILFPMDIDILLIYSIFSDSLIRDIQLIRSTFREQLRMPIDITSLSCDEEHEVRFLERLNSRYIRIK